ncbi:sericin-2-like [Palaemon carinicauda]|uniref:sericin-2-like n=1 Tax=Palaemon carinicauda TaxID=392227 RepID=UPI0035B6796E
MKGQTQFSAVLIKTYNMKFLILGAIWAVATAQSFVGQPAQLVLRRSQNKAILKISQGSFSNEFQQGVSGSAGSRGSQILNEPQQGFSSAQLSFRSSGNSPSGSSSLRQDSISGQGVSGSGTNFKSSNQGVNSNFQDPNFSSQRLSSQSTIGLGSSRPNNIDSQRFISQPSQRFSGSGSISPRASLNTQPGFGASLQQFGNSQVELSRNQQILSNSQQGSGRIAQRQQSNRDQSRNNFQQSFGQQFQQNSRPSQSSLSLVSDAAQFRSSNQQQITSQSSISQYQEESGTFEPLNLPSGATLLLGDISTSFSCIDQPYGYYADQQNSCRIFHICYPALFSNGRVETYQYSFMCGEGTRFDQKEMTCVKESDAIPCNSSPEFYFKNAEFGLPEERANL